MARECDSTRLILTEKCSTLREYYKWIEANLHAFECLVGVISSTGVSSVRPSVLISVMYVISTTVPSDPQGGMPTV